MERPSVIHVVPTQKTSASDSASGSDGGVASGEAQSDGSAKPRRSRKTLKAIKEEKEAEHETKRFLYLAAIEDVKSGKFASSWAASKYYDILCYQMIREYVATGTEWTGSGKTLKVLTKQEEKKIADHCTWRQERGFGYTCEDVAQLIQASIQCDVFSFGNPKNKTKYLRLWF